MFRLSSSSNISSGGAPSFLGMQLGGGAGGAASHRSAGSEIVSDGAEARVLTLDGSPLKQLRIEEVATTSAEKTRVVRPVEAKQEIAELVLDAKMGALSPVGAAATEACTTDLN